MKNTLLSIAIIAIKQIFFFAHTSSAILNNVVKLNTLRTEGGHIVQELCESRGGRPGLSVLTSLLVSVDVKSY